MNITYFAKDGNFGDAEGIELIDTSNFNDDDWQSIWEASDNNRVSTALEIITNKINSKLEKGK